MDLYDRDGLPITIGRFDELLRSTEYRRVRETTVGLYWVSTVWLGVDHGFGRTGRPVIFETMVFPIDDDVPEFRDLDCRRYATETEAIEGHEATVLLVGATTTLDESDAPVSRPPNTSPPPSE